VVPLKDYNPIKITPYVTYGLIALNVLIFIYELTLQGGGLAPFYDQWAIVPAELSQSFQTGLGAPAWSEWETLVTSQFLHGGFLHVGGNMLYLWIFGNNLEEEFGPVNFLGFYLLCGLLSALTQWFVHPLSTVPSFGASAAIAGVMGAYIFKFPLVRILTLIPIGFFLPTFRIPAMLFLGFWFVEQALYGFMSLEAASNIGMQGGVAYWAHAGGFVFGAILGGLLGILNRSESELEQP